MAKSPASSRLRLSGESSAERSLWFRFRFVSFRLISSALWVCRARRRTSPLGPFGLAPRAARTPYRSPCDSVPLARSWLFF
jgi:hypothetical protein